MKSWNGWKNGWIITDKEMEKMRITDVRVRRVEGETRLKGVASITIDEAFAVHELRIIEGKEGLFVAMPSRKAADGTFRDIAHPINSGTRDMIQKTILDYYEKALEEGTLESAE